MVSKGKKRDKLKSKKVKVGDVNRSLLVLLFSWTHPHHQPHHHHHHHHNHLSFLPCVSPPCLQQWARITACTIGIILGVPNAIGFI